VRWISGARPDLTDFDARADAEVTYAGKSVAIKRP